MKFNVITIFPDLITHYADESILARAQKEKIIKVNAVNLRDFTTDKHRKVDDTPYGGGPGMVLKPDPIYEALKSLNALKRIRRKKSQKSKVISHKSLTVLLSPRGRQFDERVAEEWASLKELTLVCGRYEGVDQRVVGYMVDEEISIGPYVLAGGELGALVIIEAVARLLPGVLGNVESLTEETFVWEKGKKKKEKGELEIRNWKLEIIKEYPHYTKPAVFKKWKVPEILLSGDHKKIAEWRHGK